MLDEKLDEENEEKDTEQPTKTEDIPRTTSIDDTDAAAAQTSVNDEDYASIEGRRGNLYGGHSFPEVTTQFQNRSILTCCDQVLVMQDSIIKVLLQ